MSELSYHQEGGTLIPVLTIPDDTRIGKYGIMHQQYLRDHHMGFYNAMLLRGTLYPYLKVIDREANEMLARIMVQLARKEGITESLKARDQMAWVSAMGSIHSRAEEMVLNDLIYV